MPTISMHDYEVIKTIFLEYQNQISTISVPTSDNINAIF
jgi:hypothetical protein